MIFFRKHLVFLTISVLLTQNVLSQERDQCFFNDSVFNISPVSVNTSLSDFGPLVIGDTLYFTSLNDSFKNKKNQKSYYDLFKSPLDKQGNTGRRIPVPEFMTRYNDGPTAYCEKTGELFITQNYVDPSIKRFPFRDEIIRLRIVIAKKINGKWIMSAEFPYYSPEYSVGHPAITTTGDTLVFSSDMAGGFGESDLYFSVREKGKWGKPVNLGQGINSMGKELFPFITDRGFNGSYLVFASNGRKGKGGLDLYYTKFPIEYSEVEHFADPINTRFDDFGLTIPSGAECGFLTSNRPGAGDDDIYRFTFLRKKEHSIQPQKKFREIYFLNKENLKPISEVSLFTPEKKFYLSDSTGKITTFPLNENDCEITANAFGYTAAKILLKAIHPGQSILIRDTIWMEVYKEQKIILKNIYFEFDKSEILAETAKELDRVVAFLRDNPLYQVQLSSYTDDSGTDAYNLELSQSRADSAVNYMISKGVEKSRISGKGYGKNLPIHRGIPGKPLTLKDHRENRRMEIYLSSYRPQQSTVNEIKRPSGENLTEIAKPLFRYYLILSSFTDREQAGAFFKRAKAEGLKVILLEDNNKIRIGIGYGSRDIAKKSLEYFKEKYKFSWIMVRPAQ